MIGKSFDMSAHLPPALAKVQKCTNVQGVVVQKYKSGGSKVEKCTNVQGVVVQMQKFTTVQL